jgi:hypothetical protein
MTPPESPAERSCQMHDPYPSGGSVAHIAAGALRMEGDHILSWRSVRGEASR